MRTIQGLFLGTLLLLVAMWAPARLAAQDQREGRLDLYIIIDNNPQLVESWMHAATWLCEEFVDKRMVAGDTLTILLASSSEALLDHQVLTDPGNTSSFIQAIRSIPMAPSSASLSSSIHKVNSAVRERKNERRVPCILLASTLRSARRDPGLSTSLAYSRVEDYPGWKLVTIASEETRSLIQGMRLAFVPN